MGCGNDSVVCNINDVMLILNQSNKNISAIQSLIDNIPQVSSKPKKGFNIKEAVTGYYQTYKETLDEVYIATKKIQKFIYKSQLLQIKELVEPQEATAKVANSQLSANTVSSKELNSTFTENTLVISETQGKIILPYKLEEVNRILFTHKDTYSSLEDVINKLYTLPISNYKHSSVARFREAYKLMSKSNGSSKLKALSLASELFMNYNLHPAIITACKSVDELDVYLACLEDNTLQDFRFFDIKYEIPPIAVNT